VGDALDKFLRRAWALPNENERSEEIPGVSTSFEVVTRNQVKGLARLGQNQENYITL
jgi:hypothetical protein